MKENQKITKALDTYFKDITEYAKNYKQGDSFQNASCYKNGFKELALLLKEEYEQKYHIKYDFMKGRGLEVEPKIFIKKNSQDKNTARDGIYIYIVLSTTEKSIFLSLEIGQDTRYNQKEDTFITNIQKFKHKYQESLQALEEAISKIGLCEMESLSSCIIKIKIKDYENILSYIEAFAQMYEAVIQDIKAYQLDSNIWDQNWEQYQKDIFQDTYLLNVNNSNETEEAKEKIMNFENNDEALNCIYYGVPGCGKSYYLKEKYGLTDNNSTRITFHPDYTNSDFVGQILPKRDKKDNSKVNYDFVPGPFTVALENALKKPDTPYYLVIEEINRGNASAIFGDIFQILDRNDQGESEYQIDHYDIPDYLEEQEITINGKPINKVYLPNNLYILATMNTSDQNVYPLDTAFKRRWQMYLIPNKFQDDNNLKDMYIPGATITWEKFVTTINKAILDRNSNGLNSEDKQIGVYFISKKELVAKDEMNNEIISDKKRRFAEKVLMYIWEDIAKINQNEWFGEYQSFEQLLEAFNENGLKIFGELFEDGLSTHEE